MRFMIIIQPPTARSADCLGDIGSSTNQRTVCVYVKVSSLGKNVAAEIVFSKYNFTDLYARTFFIYNLVNI
jgi:hypothetical protein